MRPSITSHGLYTRRETIYDDPKGNGGNNNRQGSNGSSAGSNNGRSNNALTPLTQDNIDDMYEIIPDNYVVAPGGDVENEYRGSSGSGLLDIPVGVSSYICLL